MRKYISILLIIISTAYLRGQNFEWSGLGIGDSYLQIKDSLVHFNLNGGFIKKCKVEEIKSDSIVCRFYDFDLGIKKQRRVFVYNKNLISIEATNGKLFHFQQINSKKLRYNHKINNVKLSIYNHFERLVETVECNEKFNAMISIKDETITKHHEKEIKNIFNKISSLDLDNFENLKKSFYMISNAPCYCLEIIYEDENKIEYCRQRHNKYIMNIIEDIRNLK